MKHITKRAQELLSQIEKDIFIFLSKQPKDVTFFISDILKELPKDNAENQIDDEIIEYAIGNLIYDKLVIKIGEGKSPSFKISSIGRKIAKEPEPIENSVKSQESDEDEETKKINEILNTDYQDLLPIETGIMDIILISKDRHWNMLRNYFSSIDKSNFIYISKKNIMLVKPNSKD
jgi:hypothetical protein